MTISTDLTLENDIVRLAPLEASHRDALLKASSDGKLWELWYTSAPSADNIDAYLTRAMAWKEEGTSMPFVVIHKASGQVIGTTRYYHVSREHRWLELGYTWYARSHWRTGVNASCKLLLLEYAFETMGCIKVQLTTDWFNHRSRVAIARLGAHQDGILRNHQINSDGTYRDTVVFSILDREWHGVKKNLQLRLNAQ